MPYALTPQTLIRIEDAKDPSRGFIVKPWGEIECYPNCGEKLALWADGFINWRGFKLIVQEAVTEL